MKAHKHLLSFFMEVSHHPNDVSGVFINATSELVISERRMQLLIANALATNLNLSIQLSMKVVG